MIGRTLFSYFAARFFKTVVAAFAGVFVLIYAVDLVEMLRRSGDTPRATGLLMASLSLLRTPTVAEQALPFAVLFGSMIAFLNLSRKLELVVTRAAGVSVWQFIAPPLAVIILIGVFSVTVYNPASAWMKQQSDRLEGEIFNGSAPGLGREIWLRQRSVDGQAILHAEARSDDGSTLMNVTVFNFDLRGDFTERLDAASARLRDGYWLLSDAKTVAPGSETTSSPTYLLATTLSAKEVAQAFAPPETVPFWTLPALIAQTERAGLDSTGYRLHFQELLARPLLLAAMVIIAACFSLRFFRMGGVEIMVSSGVAAGFVLYVATKIINDLGGAGFINAPIAGWAPGFVGCLVGVYVLLSQEDG